MSNKEFYKELGIKKGDALSLQQILQIARMRRACDSASQPAPHLEAPQRLNLNPVAGQNASDRDALIHTAVRNLDPANDAHWTQAGLPAMRAVEQIVDDKDISRDDINRLLPGFERPRTGE